MDSSASTTASFSSSPLQEWEAGPQKKQWSFEDKAKYSDACRSKDRLTLADKLDIISIHASGKNQVQRLPSRLPLSNIHPMCISTRGGSLASIQRSRLRFNYRLHRGILSKRPHIDDGAGYSIPRYTVDEPIQDRKQARTRSLWLA